MADDDQEPRPVIKEAVQLARFAVNMMYVVLALFIAVTINNMTNGCTRKCECPQPAEQPCWPSDIRGTGSAGDPLRVEKVP